MQKTYKKTTITEEPRLVISYDEDSESPRQWSNLGYFITKDSHYNSPDQNKTIERIVADTGDEAKDQADHIILIKKAIAEETGEKVLAIYPICKYEHSGVVYSRGSKHGFDYSNNGFYIITDKTINEIGARDDEASWQRFVDNEIAVYNKWCNGEAYCFILYDENGELLDSCCGFYDLEDIKVQLPAEWKDEDLSDYLI